MWTKLTPLRKMDFTSADHSYEVGETSVHGQKPFSSVSSSAGLSLLFNFARYCDLNKDNRVYFCFYMEFIMSL